jgi:galactokinase
MNEIISYAPGRAEILGNHTDYNGGLVLSMALNCGTTVRGVVKAGRAVAVEAKDLGRRTVLDLDALAPVPEESWVNYVAGVLARLQELGLPTGGAELSISSTLPMGAGLSSSAALEVATLLWTKEAYPFELPELELVKVAQWAEHHYSGVKCGLLDQISVLMSKSGCLTHIDCRALVVEPLPIPEKAVFVMVNSGVKHALVDGEYNERRASCEQAAKILGVALLRDADEADLGDARERMSDQIYRRAMHIVGENHRVRLAREALEKGDLGELGSLMFQSHQSSRLNFENSCEELDLLVDLAAGLPGCLGARLSGGGFGGATINLVEKGLEDDFAEEMKVLYEKQTGREPLVLISSPSGGAQIIAER